MAGVTIQKRGNVYQYKFEIARIGGKRKFINKSGFRTKAEAEQAGNMAYTEYQNTGVDFKESMISYSDYLDFWYENYCVPSLKYNTCETYKNIIKNYLKPNLGKYMLKALTSVKLNAFIVEFCKSHSFRKSYFTNILKVLKGSFRDAVDIYGLIRYNPATTLRLPKIEDKTKFKRHLYSQVEIEKILTRFKDNDTFTCAFITSCYTGMRTGEVFALTWDDIDFENRVINVRYSVYDKPKNEYGRWYLGTTKTKNGVRQISISDTLLRALANYKSKQQSLKALYGKEYHSYRFEEIKNKYGKVQEYQIVENEKGVLTMHPANMVFTKPDGTFCGTDIINYPFKIIHNELGIKNCRFYDLRGSFATTILRNGVEIRDVADVLGHKEIETTENHYISSTKETRKDATDVFDRTMDSMVINDVIQYSLVK